MHHMGSGLCVIIVRRELLCRLISTVLYLALVRRCDHSRSALGLTKAYVVQQSNKRCCNP